MDAELFRFSETGLQIVPSPYAVPVRRTGEEPPPPMALQSNGQIVVGGFVSLVRLAPMAS